MIEAMTKVEIVGIVNELDPTLDLLQEQGSVQIEEIPTVEGTREAHLRRIHLDESKEHLLGRYEELSRTIAELMETLRSGPVTGEVIGGDERAELAGMSPDDLFDRITPVARDVRRLARQLRNLRQDMDSARQYDTLMKTFLPLLEKAVGVSDLEQVGIILVSPR